MFVQADFLSVFLLCSLPFLVSSGGPYTPDWDSLDKRPLPGWFDRAKVGIFLHWGVFSVPSFKNEWFWYRWKGDSTGRDWDPKLYDDFVKKNYPPGWTYQNFAHEFKAEFFNPDQWAQLFKDAGAKYVVLTSKHHEGFTMWPSNYSWNWNAKDVGPHRDLVGDLGAAVRAQGLTYGLYHSMFEWFNPLWQIDNENNFTTSYFSDRKTMPELYELVNTYHPEVIWSDGESDATDTYWKSKEFLAWLYNESPVKDTVVVNDRWGAGTTGHHGDFINGPDHFRPGHVQTKKWENAMNVDRHTWGFDRTSTLSDYYTVTELVHELIETIAYGGNMLINVGPTGDGRIEPHFEQILRGLGNWLGVNGEGIYETLVWEHQNDTVTPGVFYTVSSDKKTVYAHFLQWPQDDHLHLHALEHKESINAVLLKGKTPVKTQKGAKGELIIDLSSVNRFVSNDVAFVVKLQGVQKEE